MVVVTPSTVSVIFPFLVYTRVHRLAKANLSPVNSASIALKSSVTFVALAELENGKARVLHQFRFPLVGESSPIFALTDEATENH